MDKDKTIPTLSKTAVSKRFLSVEQLYNACKEHKYILCRFSSGKQMAINSRVADIVLKKKQYPKTDETSFVSYLPCNFHEYISNKRAFL